MMKKNTEEADMRQPLPRTAVFIDYENLFYSYRRFGGPKARPDLDGLLDLLSSKGTLVSIKIFADFSKEDCKTPDGKCELRAEMPLIRSALGTDLVDTNSGKDEKDHTDFIMLDNIYMTAIANPEIEQFILVTGDGHFHSCTTNLRIYQKRTVGVIAVKGALSTDLQRSAKWCETIDADVPVDASAIGGGVRARIFEELKEADSLGKPLTFGGTAKHMEALGIPRKVTISVLNDLVRNGALRQVKKRFETRTIQAVEINWEMVGKS